MRVLRRENSMISPMQKAPAILTARVPEGNSAADQFVGPSRKEVPGQAASGPAQGDKENGLHMLSRAAAFIEKQPDEAELKS